MQGTRSGLAWLASWGLVAMALAGCGGHSSGSTGPSLGGGGSSGAVIQGELVNRQTASGESRMVVVLRTALGIGLAEAANGDPVAGATVILTRQEDGATATTHTDASGHFAFADVLPATYTITVAGKNVAPPFVPLTVGAGDLANITGTVTVNNTVNFPVNGVTVAAVETDATIILQNDTQVAHLLNIAKAAGLVSADPVLKLREAGWGWGRIAQHFNVSPGVIGLGHAGVSDSDIQDFRAAHGHGNGNGNSSGNGNNGKGKGKGKNA